MAFPYGKILESESFPFIVGPQEKRFSVHRALIAHHSRPLERLISGELAEAKEGCARLDDTDADTFVRVSEYLYTYDYQASEPEKLELELTQDNTLDVDASEPETGQENPLTEHIIDEERTTDEEELRRLPKWKRKANKRVQLRGTSAAHEWLEEQKPFEEYNGQDLTIEPRNIWNLTSPYAVKERVSGLWELFKQRQLRSPKKPHTVSENDDPSESWKKIFLCHAQVYAFADKYDISMLRHLALYKLQQTLAVFQLYEERVDDVVELLSYTYKHTPTRDSSIDDLRLLIVQYATCKLEMLAASSRFRTMLEEPGPFSKDLLDSTLWRLD